MFSTKAATFTFSNTHTSPRHSDPCMKKSDRSRGVGWTGLFEFTSRMIPVQFKLVLTGIQWPQMCGGWVVLFLERDTIPVTLQQSSCFARLLEESEDSSSN